MSNAGMQHGNLEAYVRTFGRHTIGEYPFRDVDGLVLSYIIYYNWKNIVPGTGEQIDLKTAADRYYQEGRACMKIVRGEFLRAVADSKRFGDMKLSDYVEKETEGENPVRFTAMNIAFDDGRHFLVFRGLDDTVAGWRELFQMSYEPLPCEEEALAYLTRIVLRDPDSRPLYYTGGFSKGGTMALYAASKVGPLVQKRIRGIYAYDSPAIRTAVSNSVEFRRIGDRFRKVVPEDSFVGMIFETKNPGKVVLSSADGPRQHDPMTWSIENGQFLTIRKDMLKEQHSVKIVNRWCGMTTNVQKKEFIKFLFNTIDTMRNNYDYEDILTAFIGKIKRQVETIIITKPVMWYAVLNLLRSFLTYAAEGWHD